MPPPHIANLNIVQDTQAHAAPVTLRRGIKQATFVIRDGDGISDGGQGLKYNFSHIFSIIYVYIFLLIYASSRRRARRRPLRNPNPLQPCATIESTGGRAASQQAAGGDKSGGAPSGPPNSRLPSPYIW